MSTKIRAQEIYNEHISLASTDGRNFRKTVMDQIMAELNVTLASAATLYNNAKKAVPVEGLGRAPAPKGIRKPGSSTKAKTQDLVDDSECFTVIELIPTSGIFTVGRTQSFLMQGDASEKFDDKILAWPACHWVMQTGLGPNHGDTWKLDIGEKEIKSYHPCKEIS